MAFGALSQAWQWFVPTWTAGDDRGLVSDVREVAAAFEHLSDAELREQVAELRIEAGQHEITPLAMARRSLPPAAEALRRELGLRPYDVQLLAALAMARGAAAEMQTGEGKTLAVALVACHLALTGRGVHVATPNRYLAGRDYQSLRPVFARLGLSAGLLIEGAPSPVKRAAYACDITYGPGYEFGFDYLRDQLAHLEHHNRPLGQRQRDLLQGRPADGPQNVQRGLLTAIVDEIDSVLIDEAGLPLVLSGGGSDPGSEAQLCRLATLAAQRLLVEVDYRVDRSARSVTLTETGLRRIHQADLTPPVPRLPRPWAVYIRQALRAVLLFERNVDYIVAEGKLQLVDVATGRVFADRSWQDGLQQAIEFKEGLPPSPAWATAARISRQRFFRLYRHVCGTTGTATGAEREFRSVYRLTVETIPLRIASRRVEWPTRYFAHREAQLRAAAAEIVSLHQAGRPLLAGCRTIRASQELAHRLATAGIRFSLLNGLQDEDEAAIVARAGQRGAVTIATNLAGRGTDIQLDAEAHRLGGLHVVGIERHESPRVDRQLLGRAGRQGDPGSGRFFISADDALLAHDPWLANEIRRRAESDGEVVITTGLSVASLQHRLERTARTDRQRLLAHDRWLEDVLAHLSKPD